MSRVPGARLPTPLSGRVAYLRQWRGSALYLSRWRRFASDSRADPSLEGKLVPSITYCGPCSVSRPSSRPQGRSGWRHPARLPRHGFSDGTSQAGQSGEAAGDWGLLQLAGGNRGSVCRRRAWCRFAASCHRYRSARTGGGTAAPSKSSRRQAQALLALFPTFSKNAGCRGARRGVEALRAVSRQVRSCLSDLPEALPGRQRRGS